MSYNSNQLPQNQNPVIVNLSEPIPREGGKYYAYMINGEDNEGKFEICRRYSDFYHFRQLLIQRWPGCFIPPLPSKKLLGNKDAKFLEDRRKFLDFFISKISSLPYIWYSQENHQFIRNTQIADYEKILANTPKFSLEETINKYKTSFSYLNGKELNTEISMKITSFKGFLKNAAAYLQKMKAFSQTLYQTKEKYEQSLIGVIQKTIPLYENTNLEQYTQDTSQFLFIKQAEFSKEIEKQQQQNEFSVFYDMVRMELKEVEAFLEVIQQKEELEDKKQKANLKIKADQEELTKLQAGKTTFKSLFTGGSKDDKVYKLEKQIQETQLEYDNYVALIDIVTVIIGYVEIDRFKSDKQHRYYRVMSIVSDFQQKLNLKYANYWENIKNSQ